MPKTKQTKRTAGSQERLVRRGVSVSKIDSMSFECDGAIIQYFNDGIAIWVDGNITHEEDIWIDAAVLSRIIKVGDEQVCSNADA